jgi:hypothetical protein
MIFQTSRLLFQKKLGTEFLSKILIIIIIIIIDIIIIIIEFLGKPPGVEPAA